MQTHSLTSLFARLWQSGQGGQMPDPADLGTAFGMEMSLQQADEAAQVARKTPARAWFQRRTARGRTPDAD